MSNSLSFRLHVALACLAPVPSRSRASRGSHYCPGTMCWRRSRTLTVSGRPRYLLLSWNNVLEEASGGSRARDRGGSFARSTAPPSLVSSIKSWKSVSKVVLEITAKFYLKNLQLWCVYQANDRGRGYSTLFSRRLSHALPLRLSAPTNSMQALPALPYVFTVFPAPETLNATRQWHSGVETPFLASSRRRKAPTTTTLSLILGSPERKGRGRETEQPAGLLSPARAPTHAASPARRVGPVLLTDHTPAPPAPLGPREAARCGDGGGRTGFEGGTGAPADGEGGALVRKGGGGPHCSRPCD
jgi:hypothetical protein